MIFLPLIIFLIFISFTIRKTTQEEEREPHTKKLQEMEIKFCELELLRQIADMGMTPQDVKILLDYLKESEAKNERNWNFFSKNHYTCSCFCECLLLDRTSQHSGN